MSVAQQLNSESVSNELIQTEEEYVHTLRVLKDVYARGVCEELQMEQTQIHTLFPRLEELLELHKVFLQRLREAGRQEDHYCTGDILLLQFSGETGFRMRETYSYVYSRYTQALTLYTELLNTNKKFHYLIRKLSSVSLVHKLSVPHCLLLVTQRITQYPALVEQLLLNTPVGSQQHLCISNALTYTHQLLIQVKTQVRQQEPHTSCMTDRCGVLDTETSTCEEQQSVSLQQYQGELCECETELEQTLKDKLHIFSEMCLDDDDDDEDRPTRLLRHCDVCDLQGEQLLCGAVNQVEKLQKLLLSGVCEEASAEQPHRMNREVYERILEISQKLYSLQDTHLELQRLQSGRRSGSSLLEQEKQRNQEKLREEMLMFQRLQERHLRERRLYQQELQRQRHQAQAVEEELQRRGVSFTEEQEQLDRERQELQEKREKYQQDLERLREATRAAQRERERLEQKERVTKTRAQLVTLSELPPAVPPRRQSLSCSSVSPIRQQQQQQQQQIPLKLAVGGGGKHYYTTESSRGRHSVAEDRSSTNRRRRRRRKPSSGVAWQVQESDPLARVDKQDVSQKQKHYHTHGKAEFVCL